MLLAPAIARASFRRDVELPTVLSAAVAGTVSATDPDDQPKPVWPSERLSRPSGTAPARSITPDHTAVVPTDAALHHATGPDRTRAHARALGFNAGGRDDGVRSAFRGRAGCGLRAGEAGERRGCVVAG